MEFDRSKNGFRYEGVFIVILNFVGNSKFLLFLIGKWENGYLYVV